MRRRYQDFIWLVGKLTEEIEAGVIPLPIPDKQRLGSILFISSHLISFLLIRLRLHGPVQS